MEKTFIWVVLSFIHFNSGACDVSGCSPAGSGFGVLPQFKKSLLGIRQNYTQLTHGNFAQNIKEKTNEMFDEFYQTEMWWRHYLTDKVQVFAFLPYAHNRRVDGKEQIAISGLGDIRLNLYYTIFLNEEQNQKTKHALMMGGGVSLPTGKFLQRDQKMILLPQPFQIGRGSFSYQLHGIYTLREKRWGIQVDASYLINTKNEITYRFGNIISSSVNTFFAWNSKENHFVISTGVSFEHANKDWEFDFKKHFTGGQMALSNIGLDFYKKQIMFQIFTQIPVFTQVGPDHPQPNIRLRGAVSFFY